MTERVANSNAIEPTVRRASLLSEIETLLQERANAVENFQLLKATQCIHFESVLDVGFGRGTASLFFALAGKHVDAISIGEDWIREIEPALLATGIHPQYDALENFKASRRYDAIWMSHILEHSCNPGLLLQKAADLLEPTGWLLVCVPPFKHDVVRGHVSVGWNVGTLMYNLLVNGYDVKRGHFIKHGYNICAFVRKSPDLCSRFHGLAAEQVKPHIFGKNAAKHWPANILKVMDGHNHFNGNITGCNWIRDFDQIKREPALSAVDAPMERLEQILELMRTLGQP